MLTAAVLHAVWNMLVRRGTHREAFAWCMAVASAVMYLPLGVYLFVVHGLPVEGLPYVVATMAIHAIYFVLLGRAYEHGDLSLVYPIARGTGPLLVPLMAVPLLGERVTAVAALGIACIVVGVVTLQAGGFTPAALWRLRRGMSSPAAGYALATGVSIAIYSVNDKVGVEIVDPVLFGYLLFAGAAPMAATYYLTARRASVVACWRENRGAILIAGIISPLTYFMALSAFRLGQVSYLAPMREVSIVFAAVLGGVVLKEGLTRGRLTSAALTTLGVALIGVGA